MALKPLIKVHGGKWFLKKYVISNFPENYEELDYIEPFIGGGSILLNKNKSKTEVINDAHPYLCQLWKIVKSKPKQLIEALKLLKYTQEEFVTWQNKTCTNQLQHAIKQYVLYRMSRGGLKEAFAWSDRQRGGQPGDVNAWQNSIENIPNISSRIRNVIIENKLATELIKKYDHHNALFYCDPPYLHATRKSTQAYEYEMTEEDHIELAQVLNSCKGKIAISGYNSPLYDELYKNWDKVEHKVPNHSSQSKIKQYKVECIWKNY